MRTMLLGWVVAACALVPGWAAGAQVQIEPCATEGMVTGGGMVGGSEGTKNSPYTGVVKTTFEQKLADGNVIRTVARSHQARDWTGRTMTEMPSGCVRGADGQMHVRFSVNVNDPVARTNMSWMAGDDMQPKVVRVFHQPEMTPRPATAAQQLTAEQQAQQQKMMQMVQAQQAQLQREKHMEDLGDKDVNGVMAHGMRTTRTIPAGEAGNEQPLVVIDENWMSRDMRLIVMMIHDDPRLGRTVTEYEELRQGEPDPAAFQPPADYKVEEQTPMAGGLVRGVTLGTESR